MSDSERKMQQQRQRRGAAAAERDRIRNAAHGREFVGLHIRIPFSAWGQNYVASQEYESGTVVDYVPNQRTEGSNVVRPFTVAFDPDADPDVEYDDMYLTWAELLGEVPCLTSSLSAILLRIGWVLSSAMRVSSHPLWTLPQNGSANTLSYGPLSYGALGSADDAHA